VLTVHNHVAAARERLRAAGIPFDEADLDARLLAEHVLGWTTERYFVDANQPEPAEFASQFAALVARRAAREPFAYIVGHEEFWGLRIEVTPAVLIPRPETELLVELALAHCNARGDATIADVCTGSGCIAVAIARERPEARIVATDITEPALDVARHNARRHGVAARIEFRRADLLDGVSDTFTLIAANPPYVAERDRATLQPEVVDHEPPHALFAGDDGLDVIRRLLPQASSQLRPGGTLLCEFGYGQADAVAQLISATRGLTMIGLRRDLQGIPRVAVARRNANERLT
jgi:release factor glutamine methyltransferase